MAAPTPISAVLADEIGEPFPRCLVVEVRLLVGIPERDDVSVRRIFVCSGRGNFPPRLADELPEFFERSAWDRLDLR